MAADAKVSPNQSLYIQNLPDKFQKDDLRRTLYTLFSPYGTVIDVTAMKTSKMRGQAHVLFKDVQTANQAMRACQGQEFFGRQMVCSAESNQTREGQSLTRDSAYRTPGTAPTLSQNLQARSANRRSNKKHKSSSQVLQRAFQRHPG